MELWVGCVAGALSDDEYVAKLAEAGFENVGIEPTRVYSIEDARGFLSGQGLDADALAGEVEGKFISAFVRASKPAAGCCAPGAAPKLAVSEDQSCGYMKKRVLILCTGNSARSQMAEGLLRHDAGDRFEVESAGTRPGHVRPEAITVMKELGIDISGHRSKHVQEFENQSFDYVLTVCDNANESCPVFPGHLNRIHKGFEDPAALQGTEKERLVLFRRVRDEIREYLKVFPS